MTKIFIKYKRKNTYCFYIIYKEKLHIVQDMKIDKYNFYYKTARKSWEQVEDNESFNNYTKLTDYNSLRNKLDT